MSKITFSEEQIEILKRKPNVKRVSEKSITYADDFKRIFIEEYLERFSLNQDGVRKRLWNHLQLQKDTANYAKI